MLYPATTAERKDASFPSLFDGTDQPICAALGIRNRNRLNNRSLRIGALSDEAAARLVSGIYERLENNLPDRIVSRSDELWRCRHATMIADRNADEETIFEKAVAMLAVQGHMPGWFNRCPVAVGLADSRKDNRRAVDLVHLSGETARLNELKWTSGTPAHALFQVLEYGLAYVLARRHKTEFGLEDRSLIRVRHVRLEVLGPPTFFALNGWPLLYSTLGTAIAGFTEELCGDAWSLSLAARAFPGDFNIDPFPDGRSVRKKCSTDRPTSEGRAVRKAFSRLGPAQTAPGDRFLPGVPVADVQRSIDAAPGNEIGSGKFDSSESSAALAANAFGFFLRRLQTLPPLPGCPDTSWPARSLSLETTIRFPWRGGQHPVLDSLVATTSTLIGIESKRFEPYRGNKAVGFSKTYWRPVWGERMKGYERVRDSLRDNPRIYAFLDAAQLAKHAFGLRSEVHGRGVHRGLRPILFYVYAEPARWPGSGRPVDAAAIAGHPEEIARFARLVEGDELAFVPCTWRRLLETWRHEGSAEIAAHSAAVTVRYSP